MAIDKKIAFLGGGNMAEALIKGILAAGTARAGQMSVTDISTDRLEYLKKTYGITIQKSNRDAVSGSDVVLLCVKPQVIEKVLEEIASAADSGKLVISIAAGITLARIEKALTANPRVVRVMPNTPALVLAGAAALTGGKNATGDDLAVAQSIFTSVGRAWWSKKN